MRPSICISFLMAVLFYAQPFYAQKEVIPFGDFEQWQVRTITESSILGGNTYAVYAIAPNDTIRGNIPYQSKNGWSSSNVMAKVMGIIKTSVSVFPETRKGGGRCARLETCFAQCKVLGLVNIRVLVSGTVFLGETLEPIRDPNNPYSKINMGIPFTRRPKALQLDYKSEIATDGVLTKATGTRTTTLSGQDAAEVTLYLQHRWEDAEGNLHAKRVGTAGLRISKTERAWKNEVSIPIIYGDASKNSHYRAFMQLVPETYYARNSRGENVLLHEEGWGGVDEPITHIMLKISSGCQGAYIGALGNTLWVDNVTLCY